MVTEVIEKNNLKKILGAMQQSNALVCEVIVTTGLRIGDVLRLKTVRLTGQRITIHEEKTGKVRRVYIRKKLLERLKANAGTEWVFPGRDPLKHRTRQAVWADMKKVCRGMGIDENLAPHSLRKMAAMERLRKTGDLMAVQRMLNHDNVGVTTLYALADLLQEQRNKKKRSR